ncbi:MAG: D-alanyl-D-alanine carboxypeptidase family protein [Erysipelotrichaceae bacterium]
MKKILKMILVLSLLGLITPNIYAQESDDETEIDIEIVSGAAILIETQTNAVLYEENALEAKYPASITKILTVILAIEQLNMDDMTVVSQEAIDATEPGSTHIALQVGEEISIQDLCYATLLASANDAANTLALAVSGSIESFANLMNQKVEELGGMNSHFVNPSGLPDEDHYTCAYDMALITSYAVKNETFLEIFSTVSYEASTTNMQPEVRVFANGNDMIKPSEYTYEYAVGGKNGWTTDAQYTLVTYAEKDDLNLVAVVLDSYQKSDYYQESKEMFEYAFDNYQRLVIPHEEIVEEIVEIYDEETLLATSTFYFEQDIGLLLPSSIVVEDVSHEIVVSNEDSVEEIKADLMIYVANEYVGQVSMNHDQKVYEVINDEIETSIFKRYFDKLSVFVLICVSFVLLKKVIVKK